MKVNSARLRALQPEMPRYLRALSDPWFRDLVALQDAITTATYDFFGGKGMRTLHMPITTGSISSPMGLGSDSKPVSIDLFGVPTYLADSMQFMLEYGCRLHQAGCYYLMPSFRGEDPDETHLCQFYHSEAEIPGTLDDVIALVEGYLRSMTSAILDSCGEIISRRSDPRRLLGLAQLGGSLPRVTVDEALRLLDGRSGMSRVNDAGVRVLTRAGEQALIAKFGGFVWLTHPTHLSVPFYQAFADPEGRTAAAADLLFGMGETVGSGQRHQTGDDLLLAFQRHGVDPEAYDWYLQMRNAYPMQTSGFGLGVERYLCWLLDHKDIRDMQILPRVNGVEIIP
jgi:asparaginyl-tRNA synthetase